MASPPKSPFGQTYQKRNPPPQSKELEVRLPEGLFTRTKATLGAQIRDSLMKDERELAPILSVVKDVSTLLRTRDIAAIPGVIKGI